MEEEEVILVDERDNETGRMGKTEAHRRGLLHRAISVFIFNERGEMLLQQRAHDKYHSGGLWSNACCSHPRPGEDAATAAHRRLFEEMGLRTDLRFLTTFIYRASFPNGLTEHELDHVFTGITAQQPVLDPAEAMASRWVRMDDLHAELAADEGRFTAWFAIALRKISF